jgi:hypothetical protein
MNYALSSVRNSESRNGDSESPEFDRLFSVALTRW